MYNYKEIITFEIKSYLCTAKPKTARQIKAFFPGTSGPFLPLEIELK